MDESREQPPLPGKRGMGGQSSSSGSSTDVNHPPPINFEDDGDDIGADIDPEKWERVLAKRQRLSVVDEHAPVAKTIRREDVCLKAQEQRLSRLAEPSRIISEVYSPPRVAPVAPTVGMKTGFSIDLTEMDPDDGMPWDLNIQAKRDK
eukprot:2365562-Karenia_brevis.AAC.1